MARTVVYPSPSVLADDTDKFKDKIAKFVPAEVLAFFVPAITNFKDDSGFVRMLFWVGLAMTPVVMYGLSRGLEDLKKPRPHFYVLALAAFGAWAFGGFETVQTAFGYTDPKRAGFLLTIFVFVIPWIDGPITDILTKLKVPGYPQPSPPPPAG